MKARFGTSLISVITLAALSGGARAGQAAKGGSPEDAQKACDTGDGAACVKLAEKYRKGDGVARDRLKVGELLGKACDAKEMKACFDLAKLAWSAEVTGTID